MSAKNWVNKLRGLLQREDETPMERTSVAAPEPPSMAEPAAAPAPVVQQQPSAPSPEKPQRELHKVMTGTLKEQTDWSLRQIATVGDQLNTSLKSKTSLTQIERDKVLLKMGYGVVALALRSKQTQPPTETLRSVRSALKNALLSAMRKSFQKHAPTEGEMGASMVQQVEADLNAIDKEVQVALIKALENSPAPCASLLPFLAPLAGEDKELLQQLGQELEKQFRRVLSALPVQDLLL